MTSNIERARQVPIHKLLGIPMTGRKRMVKCPFHQDRTPSMCVFPDGGFHCFGCAAHGKNAVDFVMKLGSTFKEAVEELNKI